MRHRNWQGKENQLNAYVLHLKYHIKLLMSKISLFFRQEQEKELKMLKEASL